MNRLHNIDTLKCLCAIMVVLLHVHTPYQESIMPICRCAVPCFFIISGYLIYSEEQDKLECRLKRNIHKILRLLIWSTLLFAAVKISFAFRNDDFSFMRIEAWINFIIFNENPFGFHLWYIGAYLYTLVIILLLVKKQHLELIWRFMPFLLLLDLCLGKYSLILWHREFSYVLVRNFLCVGIPYFSIGMLLKHFGGRIFRFKHLSALSAGGILLFSLTSMLENSFLVELNANAARDHYISTTLMAISIFLLFISFTQIKTNILSRIGEKDSLYIYIFHPLFMSFFSALNQCTSVLWHEVFSYCAPILIIVASIIFCNLLRNIHIIK